MDNATTARRSRQSDSDPSTWPAWTDRPWVTTGDTLAEYLAIFAGKTPRMPDSDDDDYTPDPPRMPVVRRRPIPAPRVDRPAPSAPSSLRRAA